MMVMHYIDLSIKNAKYTPYLSNQRILELWNTNIVRYGVHDMILVHSNNKCFIKHYRMPKVQGLTKLYLNNHKISLH